MTKLRVLVCLFIGILLVSGFGSAVQAEPATDRLGVTPTPTDTLIATPTNTPTATATNTPPPSQPTPEPPPPGPDLVITKRAEPGHAMPGGEVTFVIEVTNRGQEAATGVVVTDDVNQWLEILEVTASQGTVSVEGQRVQVEVGVVGPGFTVTIAIRVRVREDVPVPSTLENVAIAGGRQSPPTTIEVPSPLPLPRAGRAGLATLGLALVLVGGGLALWARSMRRRRSARRDGLL